MPTVTPSPPPLPPPPLSLPPPPYILFTFLRMALFTAIFLPPRFSFPSLHSTPLRPVPFISLAAFLPPQSCPPIPMCPLLPLPTPTLAPFVHPLPFTLNHIFTTSTHQNSSHASQHTLLFPPFQMHTHSHTHRRQHKQANTNAEYHQTCLLANMKSNGTHKTSNGNFKNGSQRQNYINGFSKQHRKAYGQTSYSSLALYVSSNIRSRKFFF